MNNFTLRKAQKSQSKLRIGLAGTSGSGKTYSALLLASGITSWDKICVIDTENGSADLYDHLGSYNVITLTAPFNPERYIEAIEAAELGGMEVIIIDSITQEWSGVGGCLEIQEKLGGRYQDWGKVKPRHRKFLDKILQSSAHIITTVRSKQDYAMEDGDNGRKKVTKMGMKQVTEDGFEYELTLSFDIAINHLASASKDRTGLFTDRPEVIIDEEIGKRLKDWSEKGVKLEDVIKLLDAETSPEKFKELYKANSHFKDNARIKEIVKEKTELFTAQNSTEKDEEDTKPTPAVEEAKKPIEIANKEDALKAMEDVNLNRAISLVLTSETLDQLEHRMKREIPFKYEEEMKHDLFTQAVKSQTKELKAKEKVTETKK